jgi:DNA polymerase-3 subunit delta
MTIVIPFGASGEQTVSMSIERGMLTSMTQRSAEIRALGTTTLVAGTNDLLAERAVASIRDLVRAIDADADFSELAARDLGPGVMAEIASPSLFAMARMVQVSDLPDLPADAVDGLLAYVTDPSPDVALVLTHPGGARGRAILDKLRKAGVVEVKAESPKRWELPDWVATEFRSYQVSVTAGAATQLVDAVGEDLRALAGAVQQLAVDVASGRVDEGLVRQYFGGRAEVKGFAIADAALDGHTSQALEQLRWALLNRVDPVLVTSAFASGLRGLAKYVAAAGRVRGADLAAVVGVPPWKLKTLARQARGWSAAGIGAAIHATAVADAQIKGAGVERSWPVERLVIAVVRARASGDAPESRTKIPAPARTR